MLVKCSNGCFIYTLHNLLDIPMPILYFLHHTTAWLTRCFCLVGQEASLMSSCWSSSVL